MFIILLCLLDRLGLAASVHHCALSAERFLVLLPPVPNDEGHSEGNYRKDHHNDDNKSKDSSSRKTIVTVHIPRTLCFDTRNGRNISDLHPVKAILFHFILHYDEQLLTLLFDGIGCHVVRKVSCEISIHDTDDTTIEL